MKIRGFASTDVLFTTDELVKVLSRMSHCGSGVQAHYKRLCKRLGLGDVQAEAWRRWRDSGVSYNLFGKIDDAVHRERIVEQYGTDDITLELTSDQLNSMAHAMGKDEGKKFRALAKEAS